MQKPPELKADQPLPGTFEREVTSVYDKRMAPKGQVFVVVRVYSLEINKHTRKRDRYQAKVLCNKTDIDTEEKLKVISEHIFKQIKEKYKLEY